jgi:hypothetical protein
MRKSTSVTLTVVTAMGLTAHGQQLPAGNSKAPDCYATTQKDGAVAQDCVARPTRSGILSHFKKHGGFGATGASSKGGG